MFVLVAVLAFYQNGFENMCQAGGAGIGFNTTCTPSRYGYYNSQDSIIRMRLDATNMARHLNTNSELLNAASTSAEPAHRVAAAFAYGMSKNPHETLFILANDNHDIVSQAARESFVYIASTKYNKRGIDFGPYPGSDPLLKEDAIKLWRIFFQSAPNSKNTNYQNTNYQNKPQNKPCPTCPNQSSPNLYEVSETQETKILPKIKPIIVETQHDDNETIPGMKIKRTTFRAVENIH